jgi:transcriptional regulator with XRE-family HTH domain
MSDTTLTPLRKMRTALGLKGVDVARACSLEQSTYSKIENNPAYRASPDAAEKIVHFFGPPLTEEMVLYPDRFPRFLEPKAA